MAKDILQMLEEGVVLSDGGMIIEARRRGYGTPEIVAEHPDALRQIHADFFQAGSQVLQALTWWTSGFQLEFGFGWGDRLDEINRTAVECAREASGGEAPVAGCLMSTTARVPTSEGELINTPVFVPDDPSSHDRAKAVFDEHIAALVGGGGGPADSGDFSLAGGGPAVSGVLQEDGCSHHGAPGYWRDGWDIRRRFPS